LFYASNYCLGVNLMFRLNRQLAAMIDRVGGYDVRIEEVHHTQKKDAPSGTAITLAEGIAENLAGKQGWVNLAPGIEHAANRIERSGEAPADRILSRLPRISGYLQLGYEWSDDASTFFVKRARVNFQGDISPKIDYRLQLEFASPKIVDIYLRYKPLEALNVQVGQFKVPFSIENTHYVPLKYEFIEYSMAVCRLMGFTDVCGVNATGRDLGAQLYGGLIGRDGYSILNYNVGVFNGEGINIKDKNKSKDVVVRLMVQPLRALSFAGYYYWGEVGADYARRTRYGGGVFYDDGRWIARGEFLLTEPVQPMPAHSTVKGLKADDE